MTEVERAPAGESKDETRVTKFVDGVLRLGVNGTGPLKSADASAAEARRKTSDDDEAIASLIRTHVAFAGAQGFVTNIGGLATLPVALPANVAGAILIQTHLAAAIAVIKGHDVTDEEVRAAILLCLAGNAGVEAVKKAGIVVGQKLTMSMIQRLPVKVIYAINRKVGFALLAKYGTKRSVITLGKAVPVVGGIVGGGADAATTLAVGKFAKRFFSDVASGETNDLVGVRA